MSEITSTRTLTRILIVEDEVLSAMSLKLDIEAEGMTVVGMLTTGEEAVAFCRDRDVDVVIMDIHLLGEMDGIQAARAIRDEKPIKICFITGYRIESLEGMMSEHEIASVLKKPLTIQQVMNCICDKGST